MKSQVRHTIIFLIFFGLLVSITLPSASAQHLTKSGAQPSIDWRSVQSLPAQTRIRVVVNGKKTTCFIDSVTEDDLACSAQQGGAQIKFSKEQVSEVQLLHRSRSHSTTASAFLGLGAGAGVGALTGIAANAGVSAAKASGVGAALGATAGLIAGTLLGSSKDWFAGSTVVYRHS